MANLRVEIKLPNNETPGSFNGQSQTTISQLLQQLYKENRLAYFFFAQYRSPSQQIAIFCSNTNQWLNTADLNLSQLANNMDYVKLEITYPGTPPNVGTSSTVESSGFISPNQIQGSQYGQYLPGQQQQQSNQPSYQQPSYQQPSNPLQQSRMVNITIHLRTNDREQVYCISYFANRTLDHLVADHLNSLVGVHASRIQLKSQRDNQLITPENRAQVSLGEFESRGITAFIANVIFEGGYI